MALSNISYLLLFLTKPLSFKITNSTFNKNLCVEALLFIRLRTSVFSKTFLIWSPWKRSLRPFSLLPYTLAPYISFATRLSFIRYMCPNNLNMPSSMFVTTFSFKPRLSQNHIHNFTTHTFLRDLTPTTFTLLCWLTTWIWIAMF